MPHAQTRSRRGGAALVAAVSLVLLTAGGVLLGHAAANAELLDVPGTGEPGRLVLAADPYPGRFSALSPGDPSYWQVSARLENAARATLAVQLQKAGDLVAHPRGLIMSVAACDTEWVGLDRVPVCATGARDVLTGGPADDWTSSSPTIALRPMTPTSPEYLLVTLAVEDSAAARTDRSLMGLTGEMAVGLTAVAIDDAPVPFVTAGGLAVTGADPTFLGAAIALAAGLLGLGSALRIRWGARR